MRRRRRRRNELIICASAVVVAAVAARQLLLSCPTLTDSPATTMMQMTMAALVMVVTNSGCLLPERAKARVRHLSGGQSVILLSGQSINALISHTQTHPPSSLWQPVEFFPDRQQVGQ